MKNWVAEGIASDVNDFIVEPLTQRAHCNPLAQLKMALNSKLYIWCEKYIESL